MDSTLIEQAASWIAGDPDPATRDELRKLVDQDDAEALAARVSGSLEFGTAGLRGVVGAGPRMMNRAVVIRTSRGIADHLIASDPDARTRGVVVGYDARHDSARFARDAVAVFAAAGLKVYAFTDVQPTPLVAFAQRALDAAAAVVVTASHNPPEYNGYKVYVEGAAQIVPPTDAAISAAIDEVGPAVEVPRVDDHILDTALAAAAGESRLDTHLRAVPASAGPDEPWIVPIGDEIVAGYLKELPGARPAVHGPDLNIVYTPLHGVGGPIVLRALAEAGYQQVNVVAEQFEPDGDFPTVAFPNPEEPGAMDAALALAADVGADLVIANDPDADRLAIAVPDGDGFTLLTGNQIGLLLADHLLRHSNVEQPLVAASIVSSPMLAHIATAHGAHAEYTLTGFKWICAAVRALEEEGYTFVFGFEEALGSMVGTVVRDKDGISAAVAFADLVRSLTAQSMTVHDRWAELAARDGVWVSHQLSIHRPGLAGQDEIRAAMAQLAAEQPSELAGHQIRAHTDFRTGVDERPAWLGEHDLVVFDLADGRAMIRPSGTEPKAKIYVDLCAPVDHGDVATISQQLQREAQQVGQALAAFVGLA